MKIGISIWMFVPGTGGLYKHAEDLALALKACGHDVVVVTRYSTFLPSGRDFLFRDEVAEGNSRLGIDIRHIKLQRATGILRWIILKTLHRRGFRAIALRLYRMIVERSAVECYADCDVIHHAGQATALVGFAAHTAARKLKVPFLVQPTCHPFQFGDASMDHSLFTLADRLLVHTEYEAQHFRNLGYKVPLKVVGNGIEDRANGNVERFRNEYSIVGPIVLYVGRKDHDKGYSLVVEAFKLLREDIPEANLVCMGPPGACTADPMPHFLDLGFASEETKHDALAACTCLCVPSEGESFGLIFMEAGRYGKPVVARKLPVLEELLGRGEAGLLLESTAERDHHVSLSADDLSKGLVLILTSPDVSTRFGSNLKLISDNFIWNNVARRFEAAYLESLTNTKDAEVSR
ncbi:MAG: glycosyltransferase family 4 protein [Verrucomicrobiales bacterium]|jgi:glycosyltransferase involved in cell wall biosynthesis|nr:glycosyltransferase family 4 protein [Verrucomicrobiales bacterium]